MERLSYWQILSCDQMVGLWGLKGLFDGLQAEGRTLEPDIAPLLPEGIEQENYVFPKAHLLYEEALLREYSRYLKQLQEEGQKVEKRGRRLSPRTWRGQPREQVPWYPSIHPERCDGCGDCLTFCAYDVDGWDEVSHTAIVSVSSRDSKEEITCSRYEDFVKAPGRRRRLCG